MMDKLRLGEKIKIERMKLRLTLEDVSKETKDISTQSLSYIERNLTNEKNHTLKYLSFLRGKGVDLNTLFD